ncbi:MAG: cysteine hydrolase [Candidatus Thermoplasmatota archaeon]|uniref:Cysteine hydrolase n=2 Tax=Candidatus Sysuiplasma superficiale TaxID=2823368 RepID=A0A8J7YPT0_9ARCH|nr:cysteine hydrolase [Candidatus Sysuiplasma superficiale]MCL4347437.1 cysteine hydrolase [Candidatus Thermoplasmatota archaeon]
MNDRKGSAVIVVDMINDFVSGKFGSARAGRIVPSVARLLKKARAEGVQVIYVRDAHRKGDPELRVWGEHAMEGTRGSEIVAELTPEKGDAVFSKRRYSAFGSRPFERYMRGLDSGRLIFAGISTDICVQHNVADAFYRGYETEVVRDCVESISEGAKERALKYMQYVYGTKVADLRRVKF